MATKKTTVTKKKAAPKKAAPEKKEARYWEAVGRRKTAVARVRIREAKSQGWVVNQKPLQEYFQDAEYRTVAKEAVERGAPGTAFDVSILVKGGGMRSQAEAVRHALARALVVWDEAMRDSMKTLKFLTRDPRMRERKKFGLKRARRARQWRKR
ncbi:MAG: 30S ribosomal protein S9 [bacterium]|nr:30S ribosomal protein S9 [bacterium]